MNHTMRPLRLAVVAACAVIVLAACSTPESKVQSFNERGQALLDKGDVVKARLEFQNALQINPSAVPSLYGLALVAEKTRDWPGMYQLLRKVLELQPSHLPAVVKLGRLELASGQVEKALESAEAAHSLQPEDPDVLALRGAVFLKLGDPGQATALAKHALARDARHVDALVVLATERLQAGDGDAALAFLDRGLAGDERNVSLQMLKVQALERLGRTDKLEEVLRRMVVLFPETTDYRQLLASFYAAHKQPAKAEAEYRAMLAAAPKSAAPKLQLVRFIESVRGPDAAAAELEAFARAEAGSQDLKLALAALRLRQGNDAAAVALWQQVIAEAGAEAAGTRARGALASHHLQRNDRAAARTLIEQMLARDARDEQALFLRAGIAVDERKLDDAIADLRTILRDAPASAGAHLMLARAHELQGANELATQHFATAAQSSRFAPAFALPYAEQLLRTGRARQADGVLREVLRASPGHLPAMKMLAQSLMKGGDAAAAQAVADEMARVEGGQAAASQLQGAMQMARRDFASGIASFRRAYELAPADPQAMATVVRGYVAAGKSKEALSFLQAVQSASPQNPHAHVLQAQLRMQMGDLPAARDAVEAAIRLDPKEATPYRVLVGIHLAAHQPAEALAAADRGLQAVPGDFDLRLTRANVLDQEGRTDDAIAAYESLLAERPNAAIVANNLATLLADNRKDAASIRRAYDLAQRFRGTDIPRLKDTLGWTTHLAGKHREAADLLKSAAAQAPELAVVHYHYGMNQLALNNVQNAKEALRRSIELAGASPFPQVEEARRTLQSL